MIKVEALATYAENEIKDQELGRIPAEGEIFEVTKERLDVLLGNNSYEMVFVKVVEEKAKDKKKK